MASSGAPHNPHNCPALVEEANAQQKADQVRATTEQTPKAQRGQSGYLNIQLSDLPTSASLLGNPNADSHTVFDSQLEAKTYRDRLLPMKNAVDQTIPTTLVDRKAHVKALFMAFKMVPDECDERETIKAPYINETHDNCLAEALCWKLLELCIRRSQVSVNLVESAEPEKYKFKKCFDKNFAERFDLLLDGMARSKSLCKHLNDANYMLKVVDDPITNAQRIESNRVLNAQKAAVMKRGKEAVAAEEEQGRGKRVKTEHTTPSTSRTTPSTRNQRSSSTRGTVQRSGYAVTPARRIIPGNAQSAPAMYPGMQPTQQGFPQATFPPNRGYANYPNYNTTPTRSGGVLNNGQQSFMHQYNQMQMTPPGYSMLPGPQFAVQSYAPTSNMRSLTNGSNLTSRAPSRMSQYPDPAATATQMIPSWTPQPQLETRGSYHSDVTSGATTITAPGSNNSEDLQFEADYKYSGQGGSEPSSEALNHNGDFAPTQANDESVNEMLRQAEFDNSEESELTEQDDGEFDYE